MIRARVCWLIGEVPEAHGVFEEPVEEARKVYCTEKSIGQSEAYQARATGLNPELKLILAHAFEYHGEKRLAYQGEHYDIVRTYRTEADSIELTVQRARKNAAAEVSP